MASNMDGVGTFEMADVLARQHIFTIQLKHISTQLVEFFDDPR